ADTLNVFPVAPIHSPVFAAILKTPVDLEAPQLSVAHATLGASLGEWEGDHPGASVFAAATTYRYEWMRGSLTIPGATGSTYTATESGQYLCEVVSENAAGVTVAKSRPTTLTFPAKQKTTTTPSATTTKPKSKSTAATVGAKLASGKPVKVKAGGTAAVKVDLVNSDKTTSGPATVCGKLDKRAKKGLKSPACVTEKSIAAGKSVVATLKVKTLASARGTYKFTVALSGASQATLTAKVQVTAPRRR